MDSIREKRYPLFGFRLSPDDRHKLDHLAQQAQASRGEVVKRLLRSATADQVAAKIEGAAAGFEARRNTL